MSRADMWRCNLFPFTHRVRPVADFLVVALVLDAFILYFTPKNNHEPISISQAAFIAVLAFVGFTTLYLLLTLLSINYIIKIRSYKSMAQRTSMTKFGDDGVRDITPEQNKLVAWNRIKAIRFHQGDIYFFIRSSITDGFGIIVPRTAFETLDGAQQFYEAALALWKRHR